MQSRAWVLLFAGVLACGKRTVTPDAGTATAAEDPDACAPVPRSRVERRFAVGVIPHHPVSSLYGEASKCWIEFTPGPVVALDGDKRARLMREGTFGGTCSGQPTSLVFESVKTAAVRVDEAASSVGMPVFTIDSKRPDRTLSLRASPYDSCGRPLDTGFVALASDALQGYARWKLSPGCERVVKPQPYSWQTAGIGFDRPSDNIMLAPVAPGTCTLDVEYFDARTQVTVTTL